VFAFGAGGMSLAALYLALRRSATLRIADRLRGRGHEATVCAVDTATALDGYDAVVLGSRVYDGRDGDNRSWPDIEAWAD